MKKVLILTNSSVGLYTFRNELLEELLQKYQVSVSIPDEVHLEELTEEGCLVIQTPINRRGMNPKEDFKLFCAYRKLLRETAPDLVMLYTIKPNIYGGVACRMGRVPYVATITGLGSTFQRENFLKKMIVCMYRTALKKAECVFFQNGENRQIFEQCRIRGKKSLLVNGSGVNLEKHAFEPYPQSPVTRFLYVGRMMREKGINEFLEAARKLHGETVRFELLGYCDEDYTEELDALEKEGIIRQHGFQTDVHSYLKEASALVLPTYHEGMSNVLMEASATGRPVIATNISGCREIFEDGVTGFGCEPGSAESLIEALLKFLELSTEKRAEMGRNARRKMEREFDRRQVTDVYIKEIERHIARKDGEK